MKFKRLARDTTPLSRVDLPRDKQARLLPDERWERFLTVATVEVVNELGNVLKDRSGRFKSRVVVSSPADKVLEATSSTAAVEDFGDFVLRRVFNEDRRRRFKNLGGKRIVSGEVQLIDIEHIVYRKRVGKIESVRIRT